LEINQGYTTMHGQPIIKISFFYSGHYYSACKSGMVSGLG